MRTKSHSLLQLSNQLHNSSRNLRIRKGFNNTNLNHRLNHNQHPRPSLRSQRQRPSLVFSPQTNNNGSNRAKTLLLRSKKALDGDKLTSWALPNRTNNQTISNNHQQQEPTKWAPKYLQVGVLLPVWTSISRRQSQILLLQKLFIKSTKTPT